jgi:hypothetical protein
MMASCYFVGVMRQDTVIDGGRASGEVISGGGLGP